MADAITAYLAGEAAGAIPNGSKVIKQNSEEGDAHPDEVKGVVVSSLGAPQSMVDDGFDPFFYFVDWGDGLPVGIMGSKVREDRSGT